MNFIQNLKKDVSITCLIVALVVGVVVGITVWLLTKKVEGADGRTTVSLWDIFNPKKPQPILTPLQKFASQGTITLNKVTGLDCEKFRRSTRDPSTTAVHTGNSIINKVQCFVYDNNHYRTSFSGDGKKINVRYNNAPYKTFDKGTYYYTGLDMYRNRTIPKVVQFPYTFDVL